MTFIVIAVTAIAALQQLKHLRASNQLTGLLKVLDLQRDPVLQERFRYVREDLPKKLADPAYFVDYGNPLADWDAHPELAVCGYLEQMGNYLKWDLIGEAYLDQACDQIVKYWRDLSPVIERVRAARDESIYDGFEYLTARAQIWIARHPHGNYPRATPHVALYTAELKRR